jgi:hypothetical protein
VKPFVINPERRTITRLNVSEVEAACAMALSKPYAVEDLTDDHIVMYGALGALGEGAKLFWSKRMGAAFGGNALVFGSTIDGFPTDPGVGMEKALWDDIIFVGQMPHARELLTRLLDQ